MKIKSYNPSNNELLDYLRPCNPFGGYKKSGIGRNNSEFGLKELCNIKVVTYEK